MALRRRNPALCCMDAQKMESDALAVQTAHMLQTLLTRFESDKPVLSQVMRVVMGASANK